MPIANGRKWWKADVAQRTHRDLVLGMRPSVIIQVGSSLLALGSGLCAIPACTLFFVALFVFDAPGSTSNPDAYVMFLALCAIPSLLFGACLAALRSLACPSVRMLAWAAGSMMLAALLTELCLDPLHLRHYPPAFECWNDALMDAPGQPKSHPMLDRPGKMVCHDLPPTAKRLNVR